MLNGSQCLVFILLTDWTMENLKLKAICSTIIMDGCLTDIYLKRHSGVLEGRFATNSSASNVGLHDDLDIYNIGLHLFNS